MSEKGLFQLHHNYLGALKASTKLNQPENRRVLCLGEGARKLWIRTQDGEELEVQASTIVRETSPIDMFVAYAVAEGGNVPCGFPGGLPNNALFLSSGDEIVEVSTGEVLATVGGTTTISEYPAWPARIMQGFSRAVDAFQTISVVIRLKGDFLPVSPRYALGDALVVVGKNDGESIIDPTILRSMNSSFKLPVDVGSSGANSNLIVHQVRNSFGTWTPYLVVNGAGNDANAKALALGAWDVEELNLRARPRTTYWNGYVEGDYTFAYEDPKNSFDNRLGSNSGAVLRGSRIIPVADLSVGDVIRFSWRGEKSQVSTTYDIEAMLYLQPGVYLSSLSPEMPASAVNCDIEFDAEITIRAKDSSNVTINTFQTMRIWKGTDHSLISQTHEPWYSQTIGVDESLEIGFGLSYDDPGFSKPRQTSCRIYREGGV